MKVITLFLVVIFALVLCDGAKILGVFHPPAPSHYFLGSKLMLELAKKGHDVTMISSFRAKNPPPNYKECYLSGFVEEAESMKEVMMKMPEKSFVEHMTNMLGFGANMTQNTLEHPDVQKLLKSQEKFDLVIVEMFLSEALLGFGYHFQAPVVVLSTIGANTWVNQITGNPAPSSYIPQVLGDVSERMTFFGRLKNLLVGYFFDLAQYFNVKAQDELVLKHFPGAPSVAELFKNVAVILLNSHVSVSSPKPHMPNMIEIGGFHIDDPKELPKDLKSYLDSSTKGVILFSMGSNFQSKYLPEKTIENMLKVFSKLPYNILWKYESPDLPGKPANVRIEKWLPQNDILAHPNLKLFITHGGMLSTTEAIYHGVPVVGLPIFGDQKMNMARSEEIGIGKSLDLQNLNENDLIRIIKEVVDNKKYRENVKRRSSIMKDRVVKPIDNAIYWIEYVIRHKGADHFKSAAIHLRWYELYQIDVVALLLSSLSALLLVFLYIPYKIAKYICCKKSKKVKQDLKKKIK